MINTTIYFVDYSGLLYLKGRQYHIPRIGEDIELIKDSKKIEAKVKK